MQTFQERTGGEATGHTLSPTVTGTSVLGLCYHGGVMLATDTLGSYGSLARYSKLSRIYHMNKQVVVAGAGDYADFQYIVEKLQEMQLANDLQHDGHQETPKAVLSFLVRMLYQRRSKFNPLWNHLVVAGYANGVPTLGYIDKLGVTYEAKTVGTGFGAYIGLPLLREAVAKNPQMSKEEARQLLEECMRVLYYRDGRASDMIEMADITAEGVELIPPFRLDTNWEVAKEISGYV